MKNRNGGTIIICIVVAIALAVPMLVAPAYLASKIVKRNSSEVSLDDVLAENEADNYDLSDTSYEVGDLLQEVDELEELTSSTDGANGWTVIESDMARDMEVREPSIDNDDIYGEIVDEVEVYKTFDIGNVATFSVKKLWLTTDRYGYVVADVELNYDKDKIKEISVPWIHAVDGICIGSSPETYTDNEDGTAYGTMAAFRDSFGYSVGNKLDQVVFFITITTDSDIDGLVNMSSTLCVVDINENIESDLDSLDVLYKDSEENMIFKKGYAETAVNYYGDCIQWMVPVYKSNNDQPYGLNYYTVTEAEVNGVAIENVEGVMGVVNKFWECDGISINGDNVIEAYGDGIKDIKVTLESRITQHTVTIEQHDGFDVNITEATAEESATEESSSDVEAYTKQSNDTASVEEAILDMVGVSESDDVIPYSEALEMNGTGFEYEKMMVDGTTLQEENIYKTFQIADGLTLSIDNIWLRTGSRSVMASFDAEWLDKYDVDTQSFDIYAVDGVAPSYTVHEVEINEEGKASGVLVIDTNEFVYSIGSQIDQVVFKVHYYDKEAKGQNGVTKYCIVDVNDTIRSELATADTIYKDNGLEVKAGKIELGQINGETCIYWNIPIKDEVNGYFTGESIELNGKETIDEYAVYEVLTGPPGYWSNRTLRFKGDTAEEIAKEGIQHIKVVISDGYSGEKFTFEQSFE